jgi:hypothetical protein
MECLFFSTFRHKLQTKFERKPEPLNRKSINEPTTYSIMSGSKRFGSKAKPRSAKVSGPFGCVKVFVNRESLAGWHLGFSVTHMAPGEFLVEYQRDWPCRSRSSLALTYISHAFRP